jgi:hypothetical protein
MRTFDVEEYEEMKNRWADKKSSEFMEMIQSVLKNDEFMEEIAESIAWSHYNDENCIKMFDSFGLQWHNALCYLGQLTNSYEDEIDREFQEIIYDID